MIRSIGSIAAYSSAVIAEPIGAHLKMREVEQKPAASRLHDVAYELGIADVFVGAFWAVVEVLYKHGTVEVPHPEADSFDHAIETRRTIEHRRGRQHVAVEADHLGAEPQMQAEPGRLGAVNGAVATVQPRRIERPRHCQTKVDVQVVEQERRIEIASIQIPARNLLDINQVGNLI